MNLTLTCFLLLLRFHRRDHSTIKLPNDTFKQNILLGRIWSEFHQKEIQKWSNFDKIAKLVILMIDKILKWVFDNA